MGWFFKNFAFREWKFYLISSFEELIINRILNKGV